MSQTMSENVVSYEIKNDNVTGEYSPATGQSVQSLLTLFQDNYGTQPQVTALVVVRKTSSTPQGAAGAAAITTTLGAAKPVFSAPPVNLSGTIKSRFKATATQRNAATATTATASAPLDWRPDYTNESILGAPGPYPFFWEQYSWYNSDLYTLPSDIGLEFEINEDNPNVFAPQNTRPACFDSEYKNRFWVSNNVNSWTWFVTDLNGGSANLGAYADYNDLEDLCRNNSIAIGLRYPKNLAQSSGLSQLEVDIFPSLGLESSSCRVGLLLGIPR